RDVLASVAAGMEARRGRTWRPTEDTAVAASILYSAPSTWGSWRRSVDFYNEGNLIWLEADGIIREQTQGQRSLDDFVRLFFSGGTRRSESGAWPMGATSLRSSAPKPPAGGTRE